MGLFGGSSKSSNTTNNTTRVSNQSTAAQDNGIALNNSKFTVNNADSLSIIKETNAFLGETFSSALGLVEKQNQSFLEGVANNEIETDGGKLAALTPIALAVTVAFVGWKILT